MKFKGRKCQGYTSRSQVASTTISIQTETYTQTAHLANETNTIQQKYKNTHSCHISRWRVDAISWWASTQKHFWCHSLRYVQLHPSHGQSFHSYLHSAAAVQYLLELRSVSLKSAIGLVCQSSVLHPMESNQQPGSYTTGASSSCTGV